MRLTKTAMQAELAEFLRLFGEQVGALYGVRAPAWAKDDAVRASPVWRSLDELYDYGVDGIPVPSIPESAGEVIGRHLEVERFLHALDTLPMKLYLDGNENMPPRLAIHAAKCAAARHVLDGGDRRTDYATDEFGPGNGDWGYLTLAEVALLANMDERSVRNAANPKLPNPLKTETVGRRSLVRPEEARRWLAGRKGFVPTRVVSQGEGDPLPSYDLTLPSAFVEDVRREAQELDIPFETNLRKRVLGALDQLQTSESGEGK